MRKSGQYHPFSKNLVPICNILGQDTSTKKKKRPCEERTTTEPVVGRNPIHLEFEGRRPLINCRVKGGEGGGPLPPSEIQSIFNTYPINILLIPY